MESEGEEEEEEELADGVEEEEGMKPDGRCGCSGVARLGEIIALLTREDANDTRTVIIGSTTEQRRQR